MAELREFDDIRPYSASEVRGAIASLLGDRQFKAIVRGFLPWLPYGVFKALMRLYLVGVTTPLGFQLRVMKPIAKVIAWKCINGYKYYPCASNTWERRYTFLSNHRDIVVDVSLLNLILAETHAPTTCEIAIGDNLLIYPWIRTVVRLNKAFIVRRSLPRREQLAASKQLSEYMHYAITTKRENLWIAQREGRAKDSSDHTQESVLKMLAIGYAGQPIEAIREMNIIPLTISYEYDPCDWLKAQEFQLKRDNPEYKKSRQDDLQNMRTGIFGYKGRVVYRAAECINTWIDDLAGLPTHDFFRALASRIDTILHSHYELYPCNYLAYDLLHSTSDYAAHYTAKDITTFETYLCSQLSKITIPNKDESFLRETILTMYANPLVNYLHATSTQQ